MNPDELLPVDASLRQGKRLADQVGFTAFVQSSVVSPPIQSTSPTCTNVNSSPLRTGSRLIKHSFVSFFLRSCRTTIHTCTRYGALRDIISRTGGSAGPAFNYLSSATDAACHQAWPSHSLLGVPKNQVSQRQASPDHSRGTIRVRFGSKSHIYDPVLAVGNA